MSPKYVKSVPCNVPYAYEDTRPDVPIFFVLSPGVDPVKDVEKHGKALGISFDAGNFALVSLGQGQEPVAEKAVEHAAKNGGWVFLQNIHLTPNWTAGYLEKRLDNIAEGTHESFRLFLSAEPDGGIPINVLQQSIKLTNEPPEG